MAQDVQFDLMKAYIHMKTYTCLWQFLFVLVWFFETAFSLYNSPACPGTCFVDQAGLKLTEIHLPLPP